MGAWRLARLGDVARRRNQTDGRSIGADTRAVGLHGARLALISAATLRSASLWQDTGLESWAIDWSPDGVKLIVASVEAQGYCGYYVVDAASRQAAQVDGVSECGENGGMVGFATLP